jgi:mannose-6-phosphate isomerase-like protein (cupin superfamily)
MQYTRLYSDGHGESHFEDIESDLKLVEYAPLAPLLYLSSFSPATQFAFMNAPTGWSSEWHPTPVRNIFFVLTGEWEVVAGDGESRRFGPGSVLLVEDTTGKGHSSRVVSETDSLAAMVQLAE